MAGKDHIKASFDQIYELGNFSKNILLEIFGANRADIFKKEFQKDESNNLAASEKKVIQKVLHYGNLTLDDTATLKVYEITLQSKVRIEQSKVGIQQYIRRNLMSGEGALVNFINPDDKNTWRLTLVACDAVLTDKGITNKKLNAKRYTFIVGASEQNKTISDRFAELEKASKIVLYPSENEKNAVSLVNTFSVEKLSTAFFDEYTLHYNKFVEYLENSNFRKSVFSINYSEKATQKEIDNANKPIRDFAKKMLGRIVFLYFVQKKGWLGATNTDYIDGKDNFIFQLFEKSGANENFYHWLSKLFFETLNKQRIDEDFVMPDNTSVKIPYLNGGLFDPEEYDNKLLTFPPTLFHSDDFEEEALTEKKYKKKEPHRGFLDFLNAFNFTVHEDSPEDHTVAVDPEMLGHIFENLLEDNKDKGAFYTPKEIVHYMCQESLLEYLKTHLKEIDEVELVNLVKNKNINKNSILPFNRINDLLTNVKICDPAIGSGAFPMGLLQEIFAIKELIAFETNSNWEPAKVKENIIQNSIYGVDIEKGAVDIARLRFWLSLIVNEEKPKALPNLDYKIVVGDSLLSKFEDEIIEIEWEKSNNVNEKADFHLKEVHRLLKILVDLQKKYFTANNETKTNFNKEIRNTKIQILIHQFSYNKIIYLANNQFLYDSGLGLKKQEILKNQEIKDKTFYFDKKIKKLEDLKLTDKKFEHFDWKLDFPEVLNPLFFDNIQNHNDVEVANHQINALNQQIEAINLYLKNNNFNERLLELQTNVAQSQITVIKEQLIAIEKRVSEIYGEIKTIDKNIVSEPNMAIIYTINSINTNIETINQKIETINDNINLENKEIGFDIVIGNPPYIDSENMIKNQPVLREHISKAYSTAKGNWDLYIPFHELAFNILITKGVKSLITPNKWLSIAYSLEFRKTYTNYLYKICNCNEVKVFEAGVTPVISFFKKYPSNKFIVDKVDGHFQFEMVNELSSKVIDEYSLGILLSHSSNILIKIKSLKKHFKDWLTCENPFTTGEAYKLCEILTDTQNLKSKSFKLINTGTIDPYISLWGLKNTSYLKEKYLYPQAKHSDLKNYFPRRLVQIESPKLIITGMRYLECYFDELGEYMAGKSTIIIKEIKQNNFYLFCALLNSKLISFYIKQSFSTLGIDGGVNFTKDIIEGVPIPDIDDHSILEISKICKKIRNQKSEYKDSIGLEHQIDVMVYHLYELSYEEACVIDNGLKREDYEKYKIKNYGRK